MRRSLWMIVSLVVVVGWLVLAYVPGVALPQVVVPGWLSAPLAVAAAVGLAAFLAIQSYLLNSTDAALRRNSAERGPRVAVARFELNRRRELFWTALPIVMTLALAAMAWGLWRTLL